MSSASLSLSTQEYLSRRLLNPGSLAIAASIGLHGLLLGIALPSFSTWSQENQPAVKTPVNVIELTEAEQSRLPNLSPAPTQNSPDVGSLPLADTSALDGPPLASSVPSNLDNLPTPPYLPSLPSLPPLSFNNRIPVAIAPRALPPSIPFRTLTAPPTFAPQFSQPLGNPINRPKFEPLPGPSNPDELINRKPNFDLPTGQSPVAVATSGRTPTVLPPGLEASLQRDEANTTDAEAMRNNVDWMAKNRIGQKPQSLEIAGNYPQAACLKQIEGSATYGIAVTQQGTAETSLLKSSGYPILNQQAARDSLAGVPRQGGYYQVKVNYKYNPKICPSLPAIAPQPVVPNNQIPTRNPITPSAIRQVPELNSTPISPPETRENSPTTPEVRRQVPAKPQTQPSLKPPLPEARRNPPETPAVQPTAIPTTPETPEPQPPTTAVQPPTAADSPAPSPSLPPTTEALKPATPLGGIAPRKN